LIGDVITTVEFALRQKNADNNLAFAMTLRWCTADSIYQQRDNVEAILAAIPEQRDG
jgi:hypothetical protein